MKAFSGSTMSSQHVPVTPEEIIDTILDELEAETARSRYSVFVRSVFHVFLHPTDFTALRPVFTHIEDEAIRALNERITALNKRSMLDVFSTGAGAKRSYRKIGDGDWKISFYENRESDADADPLIVKSLFDEPRSNDERVGTATERTVRRSADGSRHSTSSPAAGAPAAETQRSEPSLYATLEYEDELGPHQFEMVKPFIRIGRKLREESLKNSIWVDVIVSVKANVSKEHCEIRFDTDKRGFFIKDTSKFGTIVNGQSVPKTGEVRLPEKAKIQLADAVVLQFRSRM
jgi:hypothetical protein